MPDKQDRLPSSSRLAFHSLLAWFRSDHPRPISLRLLLAVNVPLGCALAVLLVLGYRREMSQAIGEQQVSLKEESIAIHQAVEHLTQKRQLDSVRVFVDEMRTKMNAVHTRNHQIIVTWRKQSIHSNELGDEAERFSNALTAAFQSGERQLTWHATPYVFDGYEDGELCVIVAEEAKQIQEAVRRQLVLQLGTLAALAIVAAVLVTIAVFRLVGRPLHRMARAVDVIAKGQFGVQVATSRSLELRELADSVNSMSRALELAEDKRRREMDLAREIQEHLLPINPAVPGLKVCSLYRPAQDVSGDYFDVLPMSDGSWLIAIADVTGHGVPAAMAAAIVKALLMMASETVAKPHEVIRRINRRFVAILRPGLFVTTFVARWYPETRRLSYANAGHPPGLLFRASSEIEELSSSGMPVGILEQITSETREVELSPGDRLVLFTDGLTEAWSAGGEMYGLPRLKNVIIQHGTAAADELLSVIASDVESHCAGRELADDLTLLVIAPDENHRESKMLE